MRHNPKKWEFSSKIQSLLFPKEEWTTAAAARRWAKQHGFKASKTHITTNYIRIRQRPPSEFTTFRTIELGESGVKAVIGEPRAPRRQNNAFFGERTERPEDRSKKLPTDPVRRYKSSHWGNPSTKIYDIKDPDLPDELVKMGDLLEIKVKGGATIDAFTPKCLLAFSPRLDERMYNILTKKCQKGMKRLINPKREWVSLTDAADQVGGRQADFTYPPIEIQVLGEVVHLVYHTDKVGDGPSDYIHTMGEESGVMPLLGVDRDGRLWYAGGDYSVPDEGITN